MKHFLIIIYLLFFAVTAQGQTIINGLIRSSENNAPIGGVTVQVNGTRLATTSNETGRFSIAFRGKDAQLNISHIGYQTVSMRITASKDTFVQVMLTPKANELQEVQVSTGYQNLPKERSTGSFSLVDRKALELQASTDVLSRLEATANGLTVDRSTGTSGQLVIRGLSTIQGPRSPLIVVDNFPYEGDINNINPNDIESVTVLKDAAAASIWGARAGNGVIVISTKKAKFNQPVTVDFNAFVATAAKPDLGYVRQMSSSDFVNVEQQLYSKGFYNDWINSTNRRVLSDVVELLLAKDQGKMTAEAVNTQLSALRQHDIRDDLTNYVYQWQFNQQYALSVRGGAAKSNWTGSTGYDRDLSNLDALYDRVNARFQQVYRPVEALTLQGGILYTRADTRSGRQGLGGITQYANSILPYARLADAQGNPVALPKTYSSSYLTSLNGKGLLDWRYFPLSDSENDRQRSGQQDVVLNTGLNYKLPLGFAIDFKYLYERQSNDTHNLRGSQSFFARDLVNSFTQVNGNTLNRIIPAGGVLDNSTERLTVNNFRGQLNFDRSWGKHEVNALAGSELRRTTRAGNSSRLYGYDDDILTFGMTDYRTAYPHYVTGTQNFVPDGNSISEIKTNFVSTFINAAYTYDRKYALSFSARRDASNLFGLSTNDQWNPFYSVGLSWLASDETFLQAKWLNYLKFRGTYGISGNIDPAMSAVTTIQYATNSPYTGQPFSRFINYANPDLRWESSRMLNLGADFQLFDQRISGSIEYYHKNSRDLFGTALIDYTTGIGNAVTKNVASISGNGIDMELQAKVFNGRFKWSPSINLSYFRDQVTDYYLANTQGSSFLGPNPTISGVTGKPVYSIFAYRWAGLDPSNGDPQGFDGVNVSKDYIKLTGANTTVNDLEYFASALPTWFGSFNHSFSYGQLSLNVSLVYKFGYYFRRSSISYTDLYNNWNGHADYALRWQKPGDELHTTVPSASYPAVSSRDAFYLGSAALVEKGDHVRLQYINLAYEFTRQRWRRLPFRTLQVYFNTSNLGIIWRANNHRLDPDYNYYSTTLINPAVYAIGIRANIN